MDHHNDIPISYMHFTRTWHDVQPTLVVSEKFEGACDRCCKLKMKIDEAVTLEARGVAQANYDEHVDRKTRAQDVWTRRVMQSNTENTLCLIIDFAESIVLPFFRVRPSNLFFLSMPIAHVLGGIRLQ